MRKLREGIVWGVAIAVSVLLIAPLMPAAIALSFVDRLRSAVGARREKGDGCSTE